MIESLGTLAFELVLELLLASFVLWLLVRQTIRLLRITDAAWRAHLFLLPVVAPVFAVPFIHLVARPLFLKPTPLEDLLTFPASVSSPLALVSLVFVGLLLVWSVNRAFRPIAAVGLLRLEWGRQRHSPSWLRCNSMLQSVALKMHLSVPRLVLIAGNNCGSLAVGSLGAYIVMPRCLVPMLDDEELGSLLAHELAHIKRKDTIVGTIAGVCRRLLAFSPFAQNAYRRFRWAREEAVDDLAVRSSGHPLALASCSVKACRLVQSQSHHFASNKGLPTSIDATESRIRRLCDKPIGTVKLPRWYPWAYAAIIASVVMFLLLVV